MLVRQKSRFSLFLALSCGFLLPESWAQQRMNDFTKKFDSLDNRMSSLSGKRLSSSRLNSAFSKRISVRQWPSRYSSFGNRRYPLEDVGNVGDERFPTNQLPVKTPLNDSRAPAYWERVSPRDLGDKAQASASVEFRDAYYAQLSKRVDDWMEKVNNMSLRDVNRYQFRKNRPSEPGFPVQKAGSESLPSPSDKNNLGRPSLRGVGPAGGAPGEPKQSYWLGPRRTRTTGSQAKERINPVSRPSTPTPPKKFKSYPKPLFGPKKIRVEVK